MQSYLKNFIQTLFLQAVSVSLRPEADPFLASPALTPPPVRDDAQRRPHVVSTLGQQHRTASGPASASDHPQEGRGACGHGDRRLREAGRRRKWVEEGRRSRGTSEEREQG